MAYVSASDVTPLDVKFPAESLQYADILLDLGQPSPLSLHTHLGFLHLVWIITHQLQLQPCNLYCQEFGVRSEATDAGPDLVDTTLETTVSGDTNKLARCASTLELIIDGGRLAEHMAVADTENPGTWFATLGLVFMEKEPDTPLSVIDLPLLGSDRHAEHSGQKSTKVVGGVGVVGGAQKGWTRHHLHGALVPLYHRSLNSKGCEKTDNIGGNVVCILSTGGLGMCRDPNDDGTETTLPVLAMGEESSCLDG